MKKIQIEIDDETDANLDMLFPIFKKMGRPERTKEDIAAAMVKNGLDAYMAEMQKKLSELIGD